MTVYITKYTLTRGILEVEALPVIERGQIIGVAFTIPGFCRQRAFRNDWHSTKTDAKAQAETMRLKAISTLNKKLRKLESLTFNA